MSDDDTLHALHQALNVLADEVGFREANIKGHQQNASQIARTIAQIMRVSSRPITFPAAVAAPKIPQVDVMCQPRL